MALIVQKFGGTSVGTPERIRAVARRVATTCKAGNQVIVTVSAMAGETNRLIALGREVSPNPQPPESMRDRAREIDVLLATGEQVSVALLAMALRDLGQPAQSVLGHQIRIATDSAFGKARIKRIDAENLLRVVAEGRVAVVAGFQGVDANDNITTLGRGGGDTTAVAVAAAVKADVCEIYTDVEGVFTTDPRICPNARKLARISFDEMLEMASLGAKVLQIRSVEFAKRYQVPLHVRSSFTENEGTWVVPEEQGMEDVLVSGVTVDRGEAKITVLHVPDRPGLAARLFGPIADANIVVDMIIQNASADGFTDMTFTVPRADVQHALKVVEAVAREIGAAGVTTANDVAKVSIVGLGMRSHAGVASQMFQVLAKEGINIQMISTSEIKVSVVIDAKYAELAVRVLHEALVEHGLSGEARA